MLCRVQSSALDVKCEMNFVKSSLNEHVVLSGRQEK